MEAMPLSTPVIYSRELLSGSAIAPRYPRTKARMLATDIPSPKHLLAARIEAAA